MRALCGTLAAAAAAAVAAGCGGNGDTAPAETAAATTTATATTEARTVPPTTAAAAPVELELTTVLEGLETPWALAWDRDGTLWVTERPGRLRSERGDVREIAGVVEAGEAGLMGLEIDDRGRFLLMYTAADENRVVRLAPDGTQTTLVDGIPAGVIHDGGRIRLASDGTLFVGTGDAGRPELAPDPESRAGKVLRVEPGGAVRIHSRGHRNVQGLCFAPDGRLFRTEHGPDVGDEIALVEKGGDAGWPASVGDGLRSYTPTIAPAGCAFYDADLIPQWQGSLLFVTLKDQSLRRLELDGDRVVEEEVLYAGELGRLRDVRVGPDGAVYVATSNRDGRGTPSAADDRVVRIAPAGG